MAGPSREAVYSFPADVLADGSHVWWGYGLPCGVIVAYFSPICSAVAFLALRHNYYGERWDVGLWHGCMLWWGCGRSSRTRVNKCSHGPRSFVANLGHSRGSQIDYSWSWHIMRTETTTLYGKLMGGRGVVVKAA